MGGSGAAGLVVTVGADVPLQSGRNRLRSADQHVCAWLRHAGTRTGRDQRKRMSSDEHPSLSLAEMFCRRRLLACQA
jgi:hypothetical protein